MTLLLLVYTNTLSKIRVFGTAVRTHSQLRAIDSLIVAPLSLPLSERWYAQLLCWILENTQSSYATSFCKNGIFNSSSVLKTWIILPASYIKRHKLYTNYTLLYSIITCTNTSRTTCSSCQSNFDISEARAGSVCQWWLSRC